MLFKLTAVAAVAALALTGCEEDACRSYSKYTCAQLQAANYYVMFSSLEKNGAALIDGAEGWAEMTYRIGAAKGLSECGSMAHSYAQQLTKQSRPEWGYVCCLRTAKSDCAEKHR